MWLSTVFSDRKSSPAISLVRAPLRHQVGHLALAPAQARESLAAGGPAPSRERLDAEPPQLPRRLVAQPHGAAGGQLGLRALEQRDRGRRVAAGERPAGERARAGGLDDRADRVGELRRAGRRGERGAGDLAGCGHRAARARVSVPVRLRGRLFERHQRAGAQHGRLGVGQRQPARRRLAAHHPGVRGGRAAEGQLGSRQHRVEPGAAAGLDVRELGRAARAHRGQAALGLARLELGGGDVHERRAGEDALVEPVEQRHRLGAGGAGAGDLAAQRAHPGVGGQGEAEHLAVAQQPRGLDGGLGELARLAQAAADLQRVGEPDRHRDHELALAGRAGDGDAAAQVADGVVVALAEELGEPEVVGGVDAAGQRAVVEAVHAAGGLDLQRLGLGGAAEPELGEALERGGERGERRRVDAQRRVARRGAPTPARRRSRCRRARPPRARPRGRPRRPSPARRARSARRAAGRARRRGGRAGSRTSRSRRPAARGRARAPGRRARARRRAPPARARARRSRRAPGRSRRAARAAGTPSRACPARSRSAAANQSAAVAGARGAAWRAASTSTSSASLSPGRAQRSRWCARADSAPPRAVSAAAARPWAAIRQPSVVVS